MLEIIPVIDLMNSVAVSGKSGNRSEYTPLKTIYSQFIKAGRCKGDVYC